jgi:hypothetical protein
VLKWVLRRYLQAKSSELEFLMAFRRIMESYSVDVSYQDESIAPFVIESLHSSFYDDRGHLKNNLPNLQSWLNRFMVAITTFYSTMVISIFNILSIVRCCHC